MPYAVACPRCQTIIVLETLGAFDCPTCGRAPIPSEPQQPQLALLPPSPPLAPAIVAEIVPPPLPLPPPPIAPAPPPPLEVDWPTLATVLLPPAREPMPAEPFEVVEAIDTPVKTRRETPVKFPEHHPGVDDKEPAEDDRDEEFDSEALHRRRAFRERERVARRKLFIKLAVVAVLAFVTLFTVRAAIHRINEVAEHNATIRSKQ